MSPSGFKKAFASLDGRGCFKSNPHQPPQAPSAVADKKAFLNLKLVNDIRYGSFITVGLLCKL